jgi:hypothetical protein
VGKGCEASLTSSQFRMSPLSRAMDRCMTVDASCLIAFAISASSTSNPAVSYISAAAARLRGGAHQHRPPYAALCRASTGLWPFMLPCPNASPRIRFLFVRPALCLGLPPDSQSPATPLPPANTSPCRACRGLSPPSECVLPGAQKKPALAGGPPQRGGRLREKSMSAN